MYLKLGKSRKMKVDCSNLLTFDNQLLTIYFQPLAVSKGLYFSKACSKTFTASSMVP